MKWIWKLTVLIILITPMAVADSYQPILHPNGWYWPTISGSTNANPGTGYKGWLEPYNVLMNGVPISAIHVGKDFDGNQGEPVYAVADGVVVEQNADLTGYGPNGGPGGALIAQFKTSDGSVFRAVYGHIDNPHELGPIYAGDVLGNINSYNPSHLHFGVHLGDDAPSDKKDYRGFIRSDEYTGDTYGWVNPIDYLNTYFPLEKAASSGAVDPVDRTLDWIIIKRNYINLALECEDGKCGKQDKYGHYWIEILDGPDGKPVESYGWWPKSKVGPMETLLGVQGELNGVTNFGGTPTSDPHQGDIADEEFHPRLMNSITDQQVLDRIHDFVRSFKGEWRWTFGSGQNCRTFQTELMNYVGLAK